MLTIDIFSDIICPWCYIGKQRLDRVLAGPVGEGVSVRWKAYQLQPRVPPEGSDRLRYLQARYGDDADLAKVPSRIAEEAAREGLTLRYDRIRLTPNTFSAHRLMWFAHEVAGPKTQHALAERLFEAHFCDGLDVGNADVLEELAVSTGLERERTRAFLAGGEGVSEVEAELAQAVDVGVSGVPCYLLGGVFPFPGVQEDDVLEKFITRAKERMTGS